MLLPDLKRYSPHFSRHLEMNSLLGEKLLGDSNQMANRHCESHAGDIHGHDLTIGALNPTRHRFLKPRDPSALKPTPLSDVSCSHPPPTHILSLYTQVSSSDTISFPRLHSIYTYFSARFKIASNKSEPLVSLRS